MLGLNQVRDHNWVPMAMMATADALPGYEVERVCGLVEGIAEKSMPAVGVGGFTLVAGGELTELAAQARDRMAEAATLLGGNAIVGVRYAVTGRGVEKSVLVYGTAIRCRKL